MRYRPFIRKCLSAVFAGAMFAGIAAAQGAPLSLADLLIGLRSKKVEITERNQILAAAVRERGVTFVNTPEIEKELTATGASPDLIAAIRAKSKPAMPVSTPKPAATPVPTPTPPGADFYQKRADASLVKGELDSAIADYNKALELKTDDPNIYVGRGRTLYSMKSYDLSVKDYDKAIQLNPKTAIAFLNRGASFEKLGEMPKALADYQKALEIEPENSTAKAEIKRIEDAIAAREAAEREEARKAAAAAAPPEFVNVGNLTPENATRLVTPTYSPIARQSRVTGRVTVEVELDAEGNVTVAKATSGHAMLRQAAEDAARRSRFRPATFNEKPIKAKGVIVYNFSL